jgi:CheY-like chemotaxis protein
MSAFQITSIVLADDDLDDVSVFMDILKEYNPSMQVEDVQDGYQLTKLLQHYCPDLLFLDLEMPRKNGLECLVEIRNNPLICNLPIVVFSSTTRAANIQAAYEMGANLFLIKSHFFDEYRSSLKAILELDWSNPAAIKEQYRINDRYTAFS